MHFTGNLSLGSDRLDVVFSVGVNASGEAVISIDPFPLDATSRFVSISDGTGSRFTEFLLCGTTSDGTTFDCDNLIFTSLANRISDEAWTVSPSAAYSVAHLTMAPESPSEAPVVKWHIKGFKSHDILLATSPLGEVLMAGTKDKDGTNEISGAIRISADCSPPDLEKWREDAEKLCEHLHHVMSFATDVNLAYPISEFFHEDRIDVTLYSRGVQGKSNHPPFPWLDLSGIFACAVKSYFQPAFEVRNLYFATQWFTMHGAYREANLISAMTVLENLIDSNLPEEDGLILRPTTFETLRKKLSTVVKEAAMDWTKDKVKQDAFVREFNNRFSDLKRRSFIDKLNLLARRWGVRIDDIPEANIRGAKSARDQVVHRGHYEPKAGTTRDLHDHLLTVREIVVRFILTALRFEGRYLSYVDGQESRVFESSPLALDYGKGETP